jgi:ABC-type antimicrobial peptide transport system permease subunit
MDDTINHEEAVVRLRQAMKASNVATPFTTALKIALQSLRIRFWRSIITIAGIFFAIAFLVSVLNSAVIELVTNAEEGKQITGTGVRFVLSILAAEPRQAWLVSMSLIVCVIGIANAMLMSVTERYKEIGTMKCLGALDIFVIELFLLESGFQGLVGSFSGALIGALLVLISALFTHGLSVFGMLPWLQILINIGLATAIGVFLTLLGASFPAYRASQMPPADAMRTEV